jgi:hypothetical protein
MGSDVRYVAVLTIQKVIILLITNMVAEVPKTILLLYVINVIKKCIRGA